MNVFKIAFAGAATACMVVVASTANAEPVRSVSAFPGVVSAKKLKVMRTTAPAKRESRAVGATAIVVGVVATSSVVAGVAAASSDDSPG